MSPAWTPPVSAGDPGSGRVTTSRQDGPSGSQPSAPSMARDVISAPIPSNWPLMPCRLLRYSSDDR